jgi:hypothetical protein
VLVEGFCYEFTVRVSISNRELRLAVDEIDLLLAHSKHVAGDEEISLGIAARAWRRRHAERDDRKARRHDAGDGESGSRTSFQ